QRLDDPGLRRQRQHDHRPGGEHAGLRRLEPAGAGEARHCKKCCPWFLSPGPPGYGENRAQAGTLLLFPGGRGGRSGSRGVARVQQVWSPVYVDALVLRDRDADSNGTLEERLYAQQDANWDVTALVNNTGTVVERDDYDPYGAVTFLSASWGTLSGSPYAWV